MSGDLVERLRVRRGAQGHPMGGHDGWCDLTDPEKLEAADEIVRLRAEVEEKRVDVGELIAQIVRRDDEIVRLRAAGDALAELLQGYECLCWMRKCRCGHDAVLDAWKKARRG